MGEEIDSEKKPGLFVNKRHLITVYARLQHLSIDEQNYLLGEI